MSAAENPPASWWPPEVELCPSGRSLDEVERDLCDAADRGLTPSDCVALGLLDPRDVEAITGWPCVEAA